MANKSSPQSKSAKNSGKGKGTKKGGKRRKESFWVKLARKLLGKKAEEVEEKYRVRDPVYAYDENGNLVKRPLPEDLSQLEAQILNQVRWSAYKLEHKCCGCCCCRPCGLRLGKGSMLGFIPAAGPIINVTLGVTKVNLRAQKVDLSWGVVTMMYVRHGIAEGFGLVPLIGGAWIAWYKVNTRNSFALERYLEERVRERKRQILEETQKMT